MIYFFPDVTEDNLLSCFACRPIKMMVNGFLFKRKLIFNVITCPSNTQLSLFRQHPNYLFAHPTYTLYIHMDLWMFNRLLWSSRMHLFLHCSVSCVALIALRLNVEVFPFGHAAKMGIERGQRDLLYYGWTGCEPRTSDKVVCNARVAAVPKALGKCLKPKHVLIQSVWKMRWWWSKVQKLK